MRNKRFMELGKIVSTQGVKGEVRIHPWSDEPEFLLQFDTLYFDSEGKQPIKVEKSRSQKNVVIMKFPDVNTVEDANKLRGKVIYMDRDELDLPDGVYFIQDLIGLEIIDADDNSVKYGELVDVSKTGASDVYHVENSKTKKMYYVPAVPKFIIETNLDENYMSVRPIQGMFDEDYESIPEGKVEDED